LSSIGTSTRAARTEIAQELITTLTTQGFYAKCPCCGSPIPLKRASLFVRDAFTPKTGELYQMKLKYLDDLRTELKRQLESIPAKSKTGAQAVNVGLILERLAPCLAGFPFNRNDCRSIFDPIDYVVFEGLSKENLVNKIFFVDIKTGNSRLKPIQRDIRNLVENGHVSWKTYKPGGE